MPNRNVHIPVGGFSGGACAEYHAWGLPVPQLVAEAVGGVAGGIGGGVLPDAFDTPASPNHRAAAHSMGVTGGIGYFLNEQLPEWQQSLRNQGLHYARLRAASPSLLPQIGYGILVLCYFLSGALAGLLAGYASHLALDSLTPSSLPILC